MENDLNDFNNSSQLFNRPEPEQKSSKMKPAIIALGVVAALGLAGATAYVLTNNTNTSNASTETSSSATSTASDTSTTSSTTKKTSDGDQKITAGGSYTFTGNISGRIIVETEDAVTITLKDATLSCSEDKAVIKGQENSKISVILEGTNKITATGDGFNVEGDLEISGSGSITIESGDDAIHADRKLMINGGTYNLTAHEGLEATYIIINDGNIIINASDDGINAAQKVDGLTPTVEINGGYVKITMGAGDTDGIDSNGNIIINGGTVDITGQSTIDYDGKAELNGGKLIINGTETTTIPNQMMGGGQGGMAPGEAQNGGGMQNGGQMQNGGGAQNNMRNNRGQM